MLLTSALPKLSIASQTAVAAARVDFPTPPLPTKRLIRAFSEALEKALEKASEKALETGGVDDADSLSLDSFLQILQRGVGQPALSLALEQPDHRNSQVDGEFVGDIGTRPFGRQQVCTVERPQQ